MKATRVALLLFGSGLCALVYQLAWLRLLRLVFGASTASSAAVLAIFMAGLGWGSLVLGRRADTHSRPFALYAKLEAGIALAAVASPFLIHLVRDVYVGLGGATRLGLVPASALRIGLSALALLAPTFLMGGTLPAAARAVELASDAGRRRTALLYGANTLGALCGALLTTFFALEWLGVRQTVWAASGLNLLVAAMAYALAAADRRPEQNGRQPAAGDVGRDRAPPAGPPGFVLAAAAAAGFAFFLMELVWYRMLSPLLGGSSYTFGLILAVALLGVGAGGLLYASGRQDRRPTLLAFAGTCAAEALALAAPYALGDRVAVLAMLLRPLGDVSFVLLASGWLFLTGLVVLPAAVVAGYQFPLLIGLLGAGEASVGRQVGLAYAWNTAGAIAGSLAGGFGLLPLLGATGTWIFSAVLVLALAAAAWALALAGGAAGREAAGTADLRRRATWPAAAAVASVLLLTAAGPTAVWRHTPTGVGGMPSSFAGANEVRRMSRAVRRAIVWEQDGRESSVAIHGLDEYSLLINGKADGSALRDAPTQVMSGLVGAVLHPDPRRALVVGLGTGSSAGWLAEVPSIERVDVIELEPATLEAARRCAAVNHDALNHPKVHLSFGDGRELMLTAPRRYDLIFSEPSNPYRAGVASLFTEEFYRAAAHRLGEGGIFLQWLQAYHVDSQVVRTVLATLAAVFPHVETWQVNDDDLLLVAGRAPIEHDLGRVRQRVGEEPLASALRHVLGVEGAEGFYTGFLASAELARAVGRVEAGQINTDDRPIIEFRFARGLWRDLEFSPGRLAALATARGEALPAVQGGLDRLGILELRSARNAKWGRTTAYPETGNHGFDQRVEARNAYVRGDLEAALGHWSSQSREPSCPIDRLIVAEALAKAGDRRAVTWAGELEVRGRPVEAASARGLFYYSRGEREEATRHLASAFRAARDHPWAHRPALARALGLVTAVGLEEPALGRALFNALSEPFAVRLLEETRLRVRLEVIRIGDFQDLCVEALEPFEPHVPWEEAFLTLRLRCYQEASHRLERRARAELWSYLRDAPPRLVPRRPAPSSTVWEAWQEPWR